MSRPDSTYRPDIDGLRAVAVLAVVLYHARASLIPGGFVGVDIFFVISGFLISGIIFSRLDTGSFSLLDFYRRRVQRIAPAMFVVVAITLAAAYWFMLPRASVNVARSAVFSVGSLANVYFWLYIDQGYFAADNRELPLLHLWSLGVEEQFYMVWPLVLMAIGRAWRTRAFLVLGTIAALASFVLGDLLFKWDPSFVYYLMPTRAGELLVGALVSALVLGHRVPRTGEWLGFAGIGAVAASLAFYSDATVFPGVRAMLPTLGTAALIVAGSSGGLVTRALASKPFVAIGLISYSVYLWHWPLMAFYRYGYGELTATAQVTVPLLALALGAVSYIAVEQPARALKFPPIRTIVLGYGVPATMVAAFATLLVVGPRIGVPVYSADYLAQVAALADKTKPTLSYEYVCQQQRLNASTLTDPRCIIGQRSEGEPRVLLWGDSNAAHYIGVLGAIAEHAGFSFRNVEIGGCPPVTANPAIWVLPRRLKDCQDGFGLLWPRVQQYPVVIMGSAWNTYDAAAPAFYPEVEKTVNALVARGTLVVLLGKIPVVPGFDRRCPEKQLSFPFVSCAPTVIPLTDDVARVNAQLKALADRSDRVEYFDLTPYLCSSRGCQSNDARGERLYVDRDHISMAASWQLGGAVVRQGVPPAFAAVAAAAAHPDGPS